MTAGIACYAMLHQTALLAGLDAGFAYQRCMTEIEKRIRAGDLASFDAPFFRYDPHGLSGVRVMIEIEHPDGSGSTFYSGCKFRDSVTDVEPNGDASQDPQDEDFRSK
ncbi:hypothetical protein SAMN05444336_11610 [Albimonas donghaensis]|uniref:Uncharacterized protein n=1 Tax=Albimonas donghaensis TaxID=356660 RepID=A0A1H3G2I4_9RHOB|nr:hypothetical protein [Albimonas donghaensis]SDX97237.1 hypothetical protein SAMN05444336_11610 [Albimonas donghaensis]